MEQLQQKLDTIQVIANSSLLTQEKALDAFALLLDCKGKYFIAHTLSVLPDKVEKLNEKLIGIRNIMTRLILGTEIHTQEISHIDEETGSTIIDAAAIYYPVPTTLVDLQNATLVAISTNNEYDIGQGLFILSLEDMIAGVNTVIEQLVESTNSTNDATFEWWSAKITEKYNA
jgi:hypothetical protein